MLTEYMNKKWFGLVLLIITFLFLITFMTVGGVSAQPKEIIMKVGYPMGATPGHPHYHVGRYLQKRVEELTNGGVKVQLYPQSQLGGDRETMEGVMDGTIEMAWPDSAIIVLVVPEIGVLNVPYIFKDWDHALRVLNGKVGRQLEAKCLAKGIRIGGWSFSGTRHIMTTKKPIYKLEDLKGIKIRVMETPIYIEMLKAWGATPTPVAWPEVYMALAQGVVEGQETGIAAAIDMKHLEPIRYISLTFDSIAIRTLIISEKWWQTLPSDVQAAISKATSETTIMLNEKIREAEDQAVEIAKEKYKVTITKPDLGPFREAIRAIYPKFEKLVGGREIMELVLSVE